MSLAFSAVAIFVSVASFYINYRASIVAERRQRMPVIVVARTTMQGEPGHRFELTNVGGGPALNIVMGFAESPSEGRPEAVLDAGIHEAWFNPLHLRPIRPGETLTVLTPESSNSLGLVYTDALMQQRYTVKAGNLGTRVFEGNHLPRVWKIGSVPSMWDRHLPPSPWLRTTPDGKRYATG